MLTEVTRYINIWQMSSAIPFWSANKINMIIEHQMWCNLHFQIRLVSNCMPYSANQLANWQIQVYLNSFDVTESKCINFRDLKSCGIYGEALFCLDNNIL